jgi:SAM-dependent methyltransferase
MESTGVRVRICWSDTRTSKRRAHDTAPIDAHVTPPRQLNSCRTIPAGSAGSTPDREKTEEQWSDDVKRSLRELAVLHSAAGSPHTKLAVPGIYELYDEYFAAIRDRPIVLLELGVAQGESLKTFARYFENGRIVGVDIEDRGLDFSSHPNVRFEVGDQRSAARLSEVCAAHAPEGLDIVIDDASHLGAWSLRSYRALFPFLKPGGFYVVEDWATGYWTDWPDGGAFEDLALPVSDEVLPKRIPTHDFGMVGFVKHLVDEVTGSGIRPSMAAAPTRPDRLDVMHVHKAMVVLRKARHAAPGG